MGGDFDHQQNWHRFMMIHSTRQMLETKCYTGTLKFSTYMQILNADYQALKVEKPYYFVSSEFTKFIKSTLEREDAS